MRTSKLAATLSAALAISLFCVPGIAHALDCASRIDAKSGSVLETIVELYTSEGCDSCPPADKWFSSLNYPRDGVVPLAFHVDYWDYIGWKDRFAKPAYAQRQRDAVSRQRSRASYTPQVMLDGRDLRDWSHPSRFQSRVREVSSRAPRANLTLEAILKGNSVEAALSATVAQPLDRMEAELFIAITENNLSSRVTSGENKGVVLKHDHVVRELIGPLPFESKDRALGNFQVKRLFTLAPEWKRSDLALVSFLQNSHTGEVLQALSTPLCRR